MHRNRKVVNASVACRVRSFEPPSEDLIEALMVLTRYVTAVDEGHASRPKPAQISPWLPSAPAETGMQVQATSGIRKLSLQIHLVTHLVRQSYATDPVISLFNKL